MCAICFFIVMKKSTQKYMTKIGQKTGTSKIGKNVMKKLVPVPLVQVNQNLNSGNLLVKGLYSSCEEVGRDGPSSYSAVAGSSNGDKNAIKLFKRKIPSPYATIKYPWIK